MQQNDIEENNKDTPPPQCHEQHLPETSKYECTIYDAAYQYCCSDEIRRLLMNEQQQQQLNIYEEPSTSRIRRTVEADIFEANGNKSHVKCDIGFEKSSFNCGGTNDNCYKSTLLTSSGICIGDITHNNDSDDDDDQNDHHSGEPTCSISQSIVSTDGFIDIVEHWDGTFCRENEPATSRCTTNVFLPRPCLVRNCNLLQQCFTIPRKHWMKQQQSCNVPEECCCSDFKTGTDDKKNEDSDDATTSREWFVNVCGETLVPVYHNHTGDDGTITKGPFDPTSHPPDDRVLESPMQYMTIPNYINDCLYGADDNSCNTDLRDENDNAFNGAIPYLKDWHFQFWFEQQQQQQQPQPSISQEFQYSLPNHLPYDLLNGFLLRFDPLSAPLHGTVPESNIDKHSLHRNATTTSDAVQYNDYRFVYWGPRNSKTDVHTDVLLSLSWSYNVYGSKLWTFYIPTKPNDNESITSSNNTSNNHTSDFTVVMIEQKSGELFLIPSKMKHSVINQEETISINHNWITADIVHHVWECIRSELMAVDYELSLWDWSVECYAARESMLRGCVGLNVSLYFFMILTRGLDLWRRHIVGPTESDEAVTDSDLIHIGDALQVLLDDPTIHLKDRLAATLQSDASSALAFQVAIDFVTSTRASHR